MKIGVLALQGAFLEHRNMLGRLGASSAEIRNPEDLYSIDGLILPGGESTVMSKLLTDLQMREPLKKLILDGLPVFGTCAGAILLSKNTSDDKLDPLSVMDITVKRNAYGRQLASFNALSEFDCLGKIPMTFIRAPYIKQVLGDGVEILAKVDGKITAARQNNMLAVCFHPELTDNTAVHGYFLKMI